MTEKDPVRRTTEVLMGAVLAGLLLAASACSSGDADDVDGLVDSSATEDSAAGAPADDSTPAGPDDSTPASSAVGTTISVFDLTVGMCFNDPLFTGEDEEGRVGEVTQVECFDPHDAEVFAIVRFTQGEGAEFPERAAVQDYADEQCFNRFEDFVGIPFEESRLDIATLWPTGSSWAAGDREATCMVFDVNHQKLEGTMDGAEL